MHLFVCLFKVSLWIQHLFVCLIRVVRRVMLLSRCVQLTGRSWRPSTATSAAWRSATWRCLHAPLRRWTSFWWGGRSTGAASRRHHVSYDVSAAGLWGCFSQLCVRVGGASRLPVFSPFSHSFTYSFMVGVLSIFLPRQEWASGAVGIWVGECFFFFYSIQIWVCQMLFHSGGMKGFDLRWFSAIFLNLNVHKIVIHIINVTICTLVCLGKALSVWFNVDFFLSSVVDSQLRNFAILTTNSGTRKSLGTPQVQSG